MSSRASSTRLSRSGVDRSRSSPPVRIGVGVDGGSSGRDAVVLASQLARATGAELMLIFAHEEPLLEPVVPAEMGWASAQKQARATLSETRDSLAPEARTVVHSDALVWRALCRVAQQEHRDLLVLGSGRRARKGQLGLGETAQELLCRLECPLAIAPRDMRTHRQRRLQRIGVGFDDEPEARAALEMAGSLAVAAGAELEVRGVVDDRVAGGLTTEQVVLGGDEIVARQVRSLLNRALAAANATGARARVDVTRGDPTNAVRALGADVDLLVIGSGSSGPGGRVCLGKTGKTVLDRASFPALVVPRPSDAAAL